MAFDRSAGGAGGARSCFVLVACSMKSGSTYVSKVLARYLDIPFANRILGYYGYREQNLYPFHFTKELGSQFVLHLHLKPYPPHLELIHQHAMKVVYHWRNLGDTIISFDDHVLREHWENPICFIDNDGDYRALSTDARHRYLILHGVPWYIAFHLAWKRLGDPEWIVRGTYEEMVGNSAAFFTRIIEGMGFECDRARLRQVLDTHVHDKRFNVGVAGRSITHLSADNKILLERMLTDHPQDLSELLHELPWRLGANAGVCSTPGSV